MHADFLVVRREDFTAAKIVTSSGARPDDHCIHWMLNAYPTELAWHMLFKLTNF